ncbi:MAG: potassium transporter Kup [Candidatus Omnitrophica bacterium]|nr:potassium transporter Kup [Candidatus Omnitrophota bacterium]
MKLQSVDRYALFLAIGALGIVYGDIGTSPLYALKECFNGLHAVAVTEENILGVLSLIAWSLTLIVSLKYLGWVMRADNKGEGGILALLPLAFPEHKAIAKKRLRSVLVAMGVFGAALLYGDGMITPAISVLSAVEGLEVATPFFHPWVIPITMGVLIGLFALQHYGSGRVGQVSGPIMIVWFLALTVLGVNGIARHPQVLLALNPVYGIEFLTGNGMSAFFVLGAVFLVVTGAEALYADMGHFGKRPIRLAWFGLVFPALLANYFGQGALLTANPKAVTNPFYQLAPDWALFPLVILATIATIIASQALIAGVFSLTMQAVQLDYSPRLRIEHTSPEEKGQIYAPQINSALMFACLGLVAGFQTSSNLAAAYGVAVNLTMIITTLLIYFAARELWFWQRWRAALMCGPFLAIELAFWFANLAKIPHGGWFPLLIGAGIFTLMSTWKTGRRLLFEKLRRSSMRLNLFLEDVRGNPPVRVPGTAVFLTGDPEGTPLALLHNLKHNKVLHERIVVLTMETKGLPRVDKSHRVTVKRLQPDFYQVSAYFGFMENPNVPEVLACCRDAGLRLPIEETSFFLSNQSFIPSRTREMALWRQKLFAFMARNSQKATAYYRLPVRRVVELGMQVKL